MSRTSCHNKLRSHLREYYPGFLAAFVADGSEAAARAGERHLVSCQGARAGGPFPGPGVYGSGKDRALADLLFKAR